MREELLKVLNVKLEDIKDDIDSLNELNNKIEDKKSQLDYASNTLESFKEKDNYNILKFDQLTKSDFEKVLSIVSNDAEKIFNTPSCNYDGLVYLITGINKGVSLSLTEEQKSGIEYLIRGLNEKQKEIKAQIDELQIDKSRFRVNDIDKLREEQSEYEEIIQDVNEDKYVTEIDRVYDAIVFAAVGGEKTVSLLKYLLEYNAEIHSKKESFVEHRYEVKEEAKESEENEQTVEEDIKINFVEERNNSFEEHNDNVEEKSENDISKDLEKEEVEEKPQVVFTNNQMSNDSGNEEYQMFAPTVTLKIDDEPKKDEITEKEEISLSSQFNSYEHIEESHEDDVQNNNLPSFEEQKNGSTDKVKSLFEEYNINVNVDKLTDDNVDSYREIIGLLVENNILERIVQNETLLTNILVYGKKEEIDNVIKIVRDNLSVDNEDYEMTMDIVINTMPSIFTDEEGIYTNFVKNCQSFVTYGINLIKLFDFSREVFLVNHNTIEKNYNIVKNYQVKLDYNNAKYLLVLPNVDERMDYYIESEYPDKTKNNELFDGVGYVNNYTVKLSTVTKETIKRLRYASENGKKVFGSKPNSLVGEITNLKVKAMDMTEEFVNSLFDDNFDGLSSDEVREFNKLVHNSSNVGNYADELSKLDKYRIDDLRYRFDGILVSSNKVARNYNILRSYGIDANKALHFAVCSNLIITKEEYQKLKMILNEMGGNA